MSAIIRRSQRGSTVLSILGVAIFIGFISVEMYRRNEVMLRTSEAAGLREAADAIYDSMTMRIQNVDSCSALLGGQVVYPPTGALENPVVLPYAYDPEMPVAQMQKDLQVTRGVWLRHLAVTLSDRPDMRTELEVVKTPGLPPVATPMTRYPAILNAIYSSGPDDNSPNFSINRTGAQGIPFYIWRDDGDGKIHSCFRANSATALCNDAGGYTFPNATPYDMSCVVNLRMKRILYDPYREVFLGSQRVGGYDQFKINCDTKLGTRWYTMRVQAEKDINGNDINWEDRFFRTSFPTPTAKNIVNQYICVQRHGIPD